MFHFYEKLEQFSFLTQHLPFCSLPPNLTEYAVLVPKASSPMLSISLLPKYSQLLTKISKQLLIAKTNSLF